MKLIRNVAAVALATVLVACATPYAETGYMGGYDANWVAPNVLAVSVRGNGYTNQSRVRDYAMLQASERAIEAGYRYFVIGDLRDASSRDSYYTPPSATTTTTGSFYGNSYYGTSRTNVSGGYSTPVFRPGQDTRFVMFEDVPEGYRAGQYFDAEAVIAELGPRYISDWDVRHPAVAADGGAVEGEK
jgi:hypothetical protein